MERHCLLDFKYNDNAEELGLTSANISSLIDSDNYQIRKVIGEDGDFGQSMGLSQNFMYEIINQVGNYGEIFENNLGLNSPLGLKRNLNSSGIMADYFIHHH